MSDGGSNGGNLPMSADDVRRNRKREREWLAQQQAKGDRCANCGADLMASGLAGHRQLSKGICMSIHDRSTVDVGTEGD